MLRPRRAKIVATLGPATDGLEAELIRAGVDVVRLNFSHGAPDDHARRAAAVRAAAAEYGRPIAVMQDLQGPKIRVGRLVGGGPINLMAGQTLDITVRDVIGTPTCISCTYAGLPRDVKPGDRLLLDDGRIRLSALHATDDTVTARVEEGGPLGEHKGINLPGVAVSAPALTDKDRADLAFGVQRLGVDYVALSFIRSAAELADARAVVHGLQPDVPIIVKLEKGEAIDDLDAILTLADAVMVARGDLGVELAPEQVPMLQKRIIQQANHRGIPVITATQMLESMVVDETPTRAEASDVANAVWDGSDAVMLSAETAAGQHPLLAVRMMERIVCAAESADVSEPARFRRREDRPDRPSAAVAHAARVLAEDLGASAIVGVTRTGLTAELLSRGRSPAPIYAFSPDARVCARLALWWGVMPVHQALGADLEGTISAMEDHLLSSGGASPGDTVVVAGSHPLQVGIHTNFVKFHRLPG